MQGVCYLKKICMEDVGEVKAPLVSAYYAVYLEKDKLQPDASVISWQRSLGDY